MSEIEQALESFETKRWEAAGQSCANDEKYQSIALAALREQAKREKGCPICNGELMYGAVSFPKRADGKVSIKDMTAEQADYCLKCGRKLTKGGKREI